METELTELMERAKAAKEEFAMATQEEADAAARMVGKFVYDHAEELAQMAVTETKMGAYADKVSKCRGKARNIWASLRGKKSVDVIRLDEKDGMIEIAKPKGIVGAVMPCTNPVVTLMANTMFALKGRNAIVIAPHPRAVLVSEFLTQNIRRELCALNFPADLVQTLQKPTIETVEALMEAVDVVVATGGMGMVKAAYKSGKPAYGVGPGNVQCIIDRGVDIREAVPKIIAGRSYDNGMICSGEQCVLIPKEEYSEIILEFQKNGVFYAEEEETVERFATALFADGVLSRETVGQDVQTIANLAGVTVPEGTKMILLKARGIGREEILSREKMCPVMLAIPYDTFQEAVEIARKNLLVDGIGHTCAVHSTSRKHIEYAGTALPVSRLLVNQASALNAGGGAKNSFVPTTTLGCGSWGNNSISDNLTYTHFINITRIGWEIERVSLSDEELWGESFS